MKQSPSESGCTYPKCCENTDRLECFNCPERTKVDFTKFKNHPLFKEPSEEGKESEAENYKQLWQQGIQIIDALNEQLGKAESRLLELEKSENRWKKVFEWSDNLNSKLAYALDYAHQTLIGNDKQKELKVVSDEIAILMKDYPKYHPK